MIWDHWGYMQYTSGRVLKLFCSECGKSFHAVPDYECTICPECIVAFFQQRYIEALGEAAALPQRGPAVEGKGWSQKPKCWSVDNA